LPLNILTAQAVCHPRHQWKGNMKWMFSSGIGACEVDSSPSRQGPETGSCEHSIEHCMFYEV